MHLKIRIFALAKELGIDSKELIEYCNQAGVKAKNSALASISPEQRDVLINYIEQKGKSAPAQTQGPIAPVREEPVETGGKVRKIEVSRAQGGAARGLPAAQRPRSISNPKPRPKPNPKSPRKLRRLKSRRKRLP